MRDIYIAECVPEGGLYHYKMDAEGIVTFCEKTEILSPMYMAKQNGKMFVLENKWEDGNSGLSVYAIGEDGALGAKLSEASTRGVCACHLCVTETETVYAVNYVSGSVVKIPGDLVVHAGECGPAKPRQDVPHTHYVNVTPDGKYFLVTDLGLDTIFVYDKDLNKISETKAPAGAGPRHLVFSEDGKTCFCVNELDSTVSAYDYQDGELMPVDTVSILPEGFTEQNTAAAIRWHDGLIYASNRGHNSIACLSYEHRKLRVKSITDCGGKGPRDFDIFGDILICTNENSNNVTFFKVKGEELYKTQQELSLKGALCVISGA